MRLYDHFTLFGMSKLVESTTLSVLVLNQPIVEFLFLAAQESPSTTIIAILAICGTVSPFEDCLIYKNEVSNE